MPDHAAARRMAMLEGLARGESGRDLADLAAEQGVDDRTIRRDVMALQDLLPSVQGIELRRGRVYATGGGHGAGYFADHVAQGRPAKEAIARAVAAALDEGQAVALTAGSTTYYVAREIRRARVEEDRLRGLITFTNSLPALLELVAAGIATGVLGEVFNADDSAFHSHELRSAFQPSLAIVGASGVVADPAAGTLALFSHRAEEAAFLKQLLAPVPEIAVAVDATKLGRRHPWAFTSGGVLAGKTVRLFTSGASDEQRDTLEGLAASSRRTGFVFTWSETGE